MRPLRRQFQRRKHPTFFAISCLHAWDAWFDVCLIAKELPKAERDGCRLRFSHAPTDRFKNFRSPKFRYQEAERVPASCSICADVTARACPSFDDTGQLQFTQRLIHGWTRSGECFYKFRFTWKPLPRLVFPRSNRIGKALPDDLVFRRRFLLSHELIIQVHICADNGILVFETAEGRVRFPPQQGETMKLFVIPVVAVALQFTAFAQTNSKCADIASA